MVVEWGEGLAERLSDTPPRHPARTRRRAAEVRTAMWQWSARVSSSILLAIDTAHACGAPPGWSGARATRSKVLAERVTARRARARRAADPERCRGALGRCRGQRWRISTPIVVGCGPGPFTGLRVGDGHGRGATRMRSDLPVHGVCSLDAIGIDTPGEVARGHRRAPARGVLGALPRRCARRGSGRRRSPPADVDLAGRPTTPRCSSCPACARYPTAAGLVRASSTGRLRPGAAGAAVPAQTRRQTASRARPRGDRSRYGLLS